MKTKNVKKITCLLMIFLTILSFCFNNFTSAVSLNNAYIQKVGDAPHHLKYNR